MKQFLLPLLLLGSLCAAPVLAQQHELRAGEYFFDTDPGVGNGSPLLLPMVADSLTINDAVTIPMNLAPGRHFLYVRTFADSLGSYGRWGQTQRLAIYVQDAIAYAEYFFDTDPGVGNGTALAVPTTDSINEDYAIPTTGLSTGTHYLYVRTRSVSGRWSLTTNRKQFNITRELAAAEYFIDTDPGVGNGTALAIPTADSVNEDLAVNLPGGLSSGTHYLYVRSRDNSGAWSLAQRTMFFVNTSLAAAEYFIDTDPGVGNGTPLTIPNADSINEDLSVVLPNNIAAGRHDLYVRARDVDGKWGLTQRKSFFVNSTIVAAEYFFDTDPGVGNGIAWPALVSTSDSVSDTAGIRVPCLTAGTHYVYVRTRDARGVWSLAHMDTFTLNAPTLTLTGSYPGPGPYGTPVRLKATGGEGPYLYSMSGGGFTADSVFLAANGSAVAFMATDTCGYSGSLMVNTPATPQNIATAASASLSVPSDGSWRHWYYLLDGSGDIVAAIRDNGQNLGTITAGYYRNSGAVRQFPAAWDSNKYLDRNWLINVANQPGANVGVRLYALTSEFDALNAADPEISTMSDLRVFKYDGPNEDLSFANNNTSLGGTVITPDSLAMFAGTSTNGYWMDFSVGSFSEFYQSAEPANPLYVQSLELQATPVNGRVQVNWQAVNEQELRHYTVLRSADGLNWTPLGEVPARNLSYATYGIEDAQPLTGNSFYKIAAYDLRGAITYSKTVQVSLRGQSAMSIYPNPARDRVTITGVAAGSGITLLDAAGREVWSGMSNGQSTLIRVDDLPSGIYLLRVVDGQSGAVQTDRLQVSM